MIVSFWNGSIDAVGNGWAFHGLDKDRALEK